MFLMKVFRSLCLDIMSDIGLIHGSCYNTSLFSQKYRGRQEATTLVMFRTSQGSNIQKKSNKSGGNEGSVRLIAESAIYRQFIKGIDLGLMILFF